MKRTAKYVALDVHQATTLSSVQEESGRALARTILPTEQAALVELLRGSPSTSLSVSAQSCSNFCIRHTGVSRGPRTPP